MNHQFDLWSYPLIIVAVLALVAQARTSWSWAGSYSLLYFFVLAIGVLGITFGAAMPCALVGWSCIALFVVVPSVLLSRISASMLVLDVDASERSLRKLRWLVWGKRYDFWKDATLAFALYVKGNGGDADVLLSRWEEQQDTPKQIKEQIKSFKLSGRIVLWDWSAIVEQFEKIRASGKVPRAVWISVSRAYAELGRMDDAAECLINARLSESASGPEALALTVLPYFALSGARSQVDQLLSVLSRGRRPFPEFSRLYWLGRCLAVRGENSDAEYCFNRAMQLIEQLRGKTTIAAWKTRIDSHRKCMHAAEHPSADKPLQSSSGTLADVWRAYGNAAFVQEIISPKKKSKTIVALVALTTLVFAVCRLITLFGTDDDLQMVKQIISVGLLDPHKVLAGEYWRLVTYMFLHKDETHLFVNMVGLYWFGRIAQNIYGTMRFIFLFFAAGIVGGVVHCLCDPQTLAIGDSGAVMGIFGAVAVGIYKLREHLPASVRRTELSWMIGLALSGLFVDRMMPQVAGIVHGAGLAAGIIFGLIINVPQPEYEQKLASGPDK